ncbi:albusnodin/ikarugamycin family macrolactam cyclase [Streptomyces sp. CS081A]|uniref:albusnodin/ikarugamycin family macrolactam cyclase n=1 Tax=Streptomyces TaxID=1883 RepID=UPI000D507665|nr:albusnodin/ikarugamycin family macrolactam cyclase [Streptomyces sp. CS081A]PVC74322.1 asparagine synthase [Streptomyces sp. CS081A]
MTCGSGFCRGRIPAARPNTGGLVTLGGFSTASDCFPRPLGARRPVPSTALWQLGEIPARPVPTSEGRPRVLVVGWCGATEQQLRDLADKPVPVDATWRWPGSYAVIEEHAQHVVVHTDPAAAFPVYATRWGGGWAWATSARFLASLTRADVDVRRVACAVLAPSIPSLVGSRTFFTSIEQLPPGSRVELPRNGGPARSVTRWVPLAEPRHLAHRRLRRALTDAVALRARMDPALSSDLSGGLDSTTVAVLAALSLGDSHVLDTVTIHPEGQTGGADLHYARLTAAASQGRISHHLLPLGAEHLPYSGITSLPATDEPAPSTLTQARLLGQIRWMRDELGTRTHLTGDGGDSVLFQPPAQLSDLVRAGRWRRAVCETYGWARLRRTPVLPLLRDAARMARTSRSDALMDVARYFSGGAEPCQYRGNVSWFTPPPIPGWAESAALGQVVAAAHEAAAFLDPLHVLDASTRTLVDEIREVARTARADAELAAGCGVDLHNPFLDASVIDAVLRNPLERRPPVHGYKPLLVRAVGDLLPAAVAARTTKGSFEADHYTGMRANLDELRALTDGHLASFGLLDPVRFGRRLEHAAAGVPMSLATIEQALGVEAWLHAHHRDPSPVWDVHVAGRA